VKQLMEFAETDAQGNLSLQEFLDLALRLRARSHERRERVGGGLGTLDQLAAKELERLRNEFEELDRSSTGLISRDDMCILITRRAPSASPAAISQAVDHVLLDLGVPETGLTQIIYEQILCCIKYEIIGAQDGSILSATWDLPQDAQKDTQKNASCHPPKSSQVPAPLGEAPAAATVGSTSQHEGSSLCATLKSAIMANAEAVWKEEQSDEGWTLHKEKNGIRLYIRELPGTKQVGIKVCCTMDFSQEAVYTKLTDPATDLSGSANKWHVIENFGDGFRVVWSELRIPLLQDNDFCNGEYLGEYEGALTYSFVGVKHPKCPIRKNKIRAHVVLGGWRATKVDDSSCNVTFISICNLNRSVPKAMALQGADQSAKSVVNLRKMLRQSSQTQSQ